MTKVQLAISKLRIAKHYRLAISNAATFNSQLPIANASLLANRQFPIVLGVWA